MPELQKPHRPGPARPETFDIAFCQRVGGDCTVVFDDWRCSAPFAWLDRRLELHGCAHSVWIFAGVSIVATHPRTPPSAS